MLRVGAQQAQPAPAHRGEDALRALLAVVGGGLLEPQHAQHHEGEARAGRPEYRQAQTHRPL